MNELREKIEDILPFVTRPGRYFGAEWGSIVKEISGLKARLCLFFPDVYEIGMSHTGHQVLYNVVNARDEFYAERCYSPWPDMEKTLREHEIPLYSLETFTPLPDFDVIGFTLAHELCFTNILQALDLAGLALNASEREYPLIIGGGPVAFNPEPLAPFFDCFVLGDGENVILRILETMSELGATGSSEKPPKSDVLKKLAEIPGVYVPSHYDVEYSSENRISSITNNIGGPSAVQRAFADDLDTTPFPVMPVVPNIQSVHCRAVIEPARGCTQGCRFCQAGYIYRPYRFREKDTLLSMSQSVLDNSGYTELGLLALSTTDYPGLPSLVHAIAKREPGRRLDCSLPSSRIDAITDELAQELADGGRGAGMTLAIEAGTHRLRQVINKDFTPESINGAVESAVLAGFETLKLYFMIGLPTETDEDIRAIISTVDSIIGTVRKLKDKGAVPKGKRFRLRVSVSNFVPKPHTPFQWVTAIGPDELERRGKLLKPMRKRREVQLNYHDHLTTTLEAILSRGDRRLAPVIENAYKRGGRFEAWRESFDYNLWMDCLKEAGLDPEFYLQSIPTDAILPWSHLSSGVDDAYLLDEYEKSLEGKTTRDCNRDGCTACGLQKRESGCVPVRLGGDSK